MSLALNAGGLLQEGFVKLYGPDNFFSWQKEFKFLAILNGVWGFYQGNEPIMQRPIFEKYIPILPQATSIEQGYARKPKWLIDAPDNYQHLLDIFNIRLVEWKENDRLLRLAQALLHAAVEPWVWPDHVQDDPRAAWNEITTENKADTATRLRIALANISEIKLSSFKTVRDYLIKSDDLIYEMKKAGGTLTRSDLMANILGGLPVSYGSFVLSWSQTVDQTDATKYKRFRIALLKFAYDNKRELAMNCSSKDELSLC